MKDVIFGIMGNMGPQADALFQDIIAREENKQGAQNDQEHMSLLVINNSDIPDRSEAINEGGTDPVPEMVRSAQIMELNHVEFAVMPCNTAHHFRPEVQKQTSVYLVDMLKATTEKIQAQNPQAVVGVLCTTGTYNSGIYDRYLTEDEITYFKPNTEEQENYVHSAIYGHKTGDKTPSGQDIREKCGIKAGELDKNAELLSKAIESLKTQGVNTVILGCTELPLVRPALEKNFPEIYFIDPMEAVAERVVHIYRRADKILNSTPITDTTPINIADIVNEDDMVTYVVEKARQARREALLKVS